MTLRFFGEWPEERLPELVAALEAVERPREPVEIRLERLAFLPSGAKPRVFVAVGATPKPLADFQRRIEAAARALGFEPENRAFLTHVTLGRIREPRRGAALVAAVREYEARLGSFTAGAFTAGAFTADHWTLYSSEFTPNGAIYTRQAQRPFAA